jgi:hypothetical protein
MREVDTELTRRGLVSVMNETKWVELQNAVLCELPFAPAYQCKMVLRSDPYPERFETDVDYLGDWSSECLSPFSCIEWLRVRPRFLRHRGRLVAPEVLSVESEFLAILHRYQIPHRRDGETVWIYGYTAQTGDLVTSS